MRCLPNVANVFPPCLKYLCNVLVLGIIAGKIKLQPNEVYCERKKIDSRTNCQTCQE